MPGSLGRSYLIIAFRDSACGKRLCAAGVCPRLVLGPSSARRPLQLPQPSGRPSVWFCCEAGGGFLPDFSCSYRMISTATDMGRAYPECVTGWSHSPPSSPVAPITSLQRWICPQVQGAAGATPSLSPGRPEAGRSRAVRFCKVRSVKYFHLSGFTLLSLPPRRPSSAPPCCPGGRSGAQRFGGPAGRGSGRGRHRA